MVSLGAGAQYYFVDKIHSPYLFGALAYAWADPAETRSDSDWGFQSAIGYHFFRANPVNIGVELSYTRAFFSLDEGVPQVYGLRFLFLW